MPEFHFRERVYSPSKIVCIGRNYAEHISELGNETPDDMVVFCKPPSAIASRLFSDNNNIHYEAEICFLVEGGQFVALAFGLDLTKRELQSQLKNKGLPWERAKAFDGAALFSHFVAFNTIENLSVELDINGEAKQRGHVSHMLYKPAALLKGIQSFMSLSDGDIVMTGTPAGVGPVIGNDLFEGRILEDKALLCSAVWRAEERR